MKAVRALAVVFLVLLASPSCGDPTKPQAPAPSTSLIGSLLGPTGLLKCSNLPYASNTVTIGPLGGSISAGPHTLVVPAGALLSRTAITMTAPTGQGVNAVTFKPVGLRFLTPAALTMSYSNCSLLGYLLPKQIAYTDDNLNIISYLLSVDNLLTQKVTGKVNHFSEYAVAW